MATQVPPKKNAAYTFTVALTSQADTDIFKTTPTLAAGDITVSKDGGNFANIGTLPTQIQTTGALPVALTADEMNADRVVVLFHDVAGSEWQDLLVIIDTVANQNDDLSTLTAAQVNAEVDTALADYDAPTKAELDAGLAELNDITAAGVWEYSDRRLTQTAADAADTITGENITRHRGDYWSISLTGLGSLVGRTKLYFTVKKSRTDTDAESIIQIEETAGLLYLNGAAAGTASNGSLTVTDEATGAATIVLKAAETDDIEPSELLYDVQMSDASGNPTTMSDGGTFTVTADVTRRIT